MQKLDFVGVILIFAGMGWFVYGISENVLRYWTIWLIIASFWGIGLGIIIRSKVVAKKRNLDLENIKHDLSMESNNKITDEEKDLTHSVTENDRKCKVCDTNIPPSVKICPGCGDIYS